MKALLESIKSKKILVVGDVLLDHYIWGDVTRISPEAPVPVVQVDKDTFVAGGAANVAMNLSSLGAQVELCGPIGDDDAGRQLMKIFENGGVVYDSDFATANVPTIVKTRVVVRGQQLCRLDRECKPATYRLDNHSFALKLLSKIAESDVVIVSDYAKGVINNSLFSQIKGMAQDTESLLAVDPKPKRALDYSGVNLLKPNQSESVHMAGLTWDTHDPYPAEEVCKAIYEKYGCQYLVVTLGGEGMLLSKEGRLLKIIPAYAREVYDVSGAGDTSMAALTLALACGESLESAAHFANTAAGVVVGKVGTALVTPQEVLDYHP